MRNLRCKLCLGVTVQNVNVERGCLCEAGKFSYVMYLTISVHGRVACFLASLSVCFSILLFCSVYCVFHSSPIVGLVHWAVICPMKIWNPGNSKL